MTYTNIKNNTSKSKNMEARILRNYVLKICRKKGLLTPQKKRELVKILKKLPDKITTVAQIDNIIDDAILIFISSKKFLIISKFHIKRAIAKLIKERSN